MAREEIELGTTPLGEGGDSNREANTKINAMTLEIYEKLDSVQEGATANQTDAYLLARVNHTGTQPISTVAGLTEALDDKVDNLELTDALNLKVDKVAGKGLSEEDFTTVLRDKLIGVEPASFRGTFLTEAALIAGVTDPRPGDFADVDAGTGTDVVRWIWDDSDNEWIQGGGSGGGPASTDGLPEGLTNLYFTTIRVLATLMTGFMLIGGGGVLSSDSLLVAIGKLQSQINDISSSLSGHIGSRGVSAHTVANTTEAGFMPPMPASDGANYAFKNGDISKLPLLTGRNALYNGNFQINQRAVSGTVVLAAGAYGHDGWKAGAAGCTYTFATSANVTTITISSGSLLQVIEGLNLQSGEHILSWEGTAQGKIGAGSYSATGVTSTITGGANLNIEFNAGTLRLVQFEQGAVRTVFENLPIAAVLRQCQSHYSTFTHTVAGYASNGNSIIDQLTFPVRMRATPTVSFIQAGKATNWSDSFATGAAIDKVLINSTNNSGVNGNGYSNSTVILSAVL